MIDKTSSEMKEDFDNYMKQHSNTEARYCPTCNEECKTGQMLWNGWFMYEDLYHFECIPEKVRRKLFK